MLSYAVGNLRINGLATKREKLASKREERIICWQIPKLKDRYLHYSPPNDSYKKLILPVLSPELLLKVPVLNAKSVSFSCHGINRRTSLCSSNNCIHYILLFYIPDFNSVSILLVK